MKRAVWILWAALALPAAGQADELSAANFARFHACHVPQSQPALSIDDRLQQAVKRVVSGTPLREAITAVQYRALAATMVHLSGTRSDADVTRFLSARYCQALGDVSMRDLGVLRRGRDVFLLLAAPAPVAAKLNPDTAVRQILQIVNQARIAGRECGGKTFAPAAPLVIDPALTRAATEHADDMALHLKFDHSGSDGSTPAQRVERAGFGEHKLVGENIAAGAMSPSDVAQGWLASPAHCENIMDPHFTHTGIAFAENVASASRVYWAQEFAVHR
jgi:uncharacterized protein YkwD